MDEQGAFKKGGMCVDKVVLISKQTVDKYWRKNGFFCALMDLGNGYDS